jgi:hypothetical protein
VGIARVAGLIVMNMGDGDGCEANQQQETKQSARLAPQFRHKPATSGCEKMLHPVNTLSGMAGAEFAARPVRV